MLAKVHVARKALGLDEAAYRDVVGRVAGVPSAGAASDAQLHRLLGEFKRLGWSGAKPQASLRRADKAQVRLACALWAELRPYLTDGSDAALRNFVRRQTRTAATPRGVDAPEFLTGPQANRVIEGLKAWLARARKGEHA